MGGHQSDETGQTGRSRRARLLISLFVFGLMWAPHAFGAGGFTLPRTEHLRFKCPRCGGRGHSSASCPQNSRSRDADSWSPPARNPEAERREMEQRARRAQAMVLHKEGRSQLRLEQWKLAIDTLQKALEISPDEMREEISRSLNAARKALATYNRLIEERCAREAGLTYVDVGAAMLGPDGEPLPDIWRKDRLHMNDHGYVIWTRVIGEALGLPRPER